MDDLYKKIASLPPEKRELFELMLMDQGVDLSKVMIVPQKRDRNLFPLSYSQQRLWFLDQLDPDSYLYNICAGLQMRGTLNTEALQNSFKEIIRRHEVLRTTFSREDDQPCQVIAADIPFEIKHLDISDSDTAEVDAEIQRLAVREAQAPFNLSTGPLLRVTLINITDKDHVLLLAMHHIVSDNWSTGLIVNEIMQLYRAFSKGQSSPLPDLEVQYADFSVWQRKWLSGKTLETQIDYWKNQLQGIPPVLELPLDQPRPAIQSANGTYKQFGLSPDLLKSVNELARSEDATLFMILLAAFQVLLYRYSGQDDICVGSPIANRTRKETEAMIGFFVNTLVLRGDLSGNPSFREFLARVKEATLGAYAHQDLPFESLVEALQPQRQMSHSPLFQVMFVMNNAPVEKLTLPGLEITLLDIENNTTKFDLILNVMEQDGALLCKLEYNTDLFLETSMDRLIGHFQMIVEHIVRDPDQTVSEIPLLTGDEENRLLREWNRPETDYSEDRSVVTLFDEQAAATPRAEALQVQEEVLTYEALSRRSNKLARHLINLGATPGSVVGICLRRSIHSIIGLLAVLKAGAVYLPLDPSYPEERLLYMLKDARAPFVITEKATEKLVIEHEARQILLDDEAEAIADHESTNPPVSVSGEATAYIIYTSGSTGAPKGVEIQHRAIANHCRDMADHFELSPEDNVLQFAALNFDASLEQILPTLISGAKLCMRDDEIWEISRFHEKINKFDLSVINLPTAYWNQLASEWAGHPDNVPQSRLRLVIVGGDVLKPDALQRWRQTALGQLRILNAYGPTEATITATTFEIPEDFTGSRVPIGRPRANRVVYVLDKQRHPVPVGVPGELHIGGTVLARGYLNRPELTEEKFITASDSVSKDLRLYKTGDLVRFLADGNLEFLGRVDQQVKIRGFRIELGEIEHALSQMESIKQIIVDAREDHNDQKRLIAYYRSADGSKTDAGTLRDFLKNRLPEYMIPSLWVPVEEFPLDPGGKIDRRALPAPEGEQAGITAEYVAPRSDTERTLCQMVGEILNVKKVGIQDNFFELGGHSMMATQVVSRIRDTFGIELSLRSMFEDPTVEGIARAMTTEQAAEYDEEDLEEMLDELDDLSDEDIQNLLNDDDA